MLFRKKLMLKLSIALGLAVFMSACSQTNIDAENQASAKTSDRFEGVNRKIYAFNSGLDKVILKPAAKVYKAVTPGFVDTHIGNAFSNLGDVKNVVNNGLQFKFKDALSDASRIVINSTVGFAGLVDIASAAGIEKHDEDFGQTLAKWGVKSGPYVMLPLLGPSTVRDAVAKLSIDRLTDPLSYGDDTLPYSALEIVQIRSSLLVKEELLNDLSDDDYSALKDIWLQNRAFLVNDGKVDEEAGSDLIDELEDLDDL